MKLWHVYVAIAVVAFVATGSQVLGYLDAGPIGGAVDFWDDAFHSSDASLFLTFDIFFLGLAVLTLMWVESRNVDIGTGWFIGYVVLSIAVGISTFVPLFLAHRELRLESQRAT